jgi:DNA-binding response OmpR family regulator
VEHQVNRILVVDDEKHIVFAFRQYFVARGHVVDCAMTAVEAHDLLSRHSYSVAIIDVHLEGLGDAGDGLNIAAAIRQSSPATIVIILTAVETPETERRAAEVGVHSFLRKPARLAHVADVAFGFMRETPVVVS